jgi:hypothetical protein
MKVLLSGVVLAMLTAPAIAEPYRTAVPASFESRGEDRQAIGKLLENYTKAVSTKDQTLFESLILDKAIPFSGVPLLQKQGGAPVKTANYEDFRKGVFEGAPFKQEFEDVHIEQDGTLAQVSLVFVNTTAEDKTWGWKTMQLVKVNGQWKIAAEFFTGHN